MILKAFSSDFQKGLIITIKVKLSGFFIAADDTVPKVVSKVPFMMLRSLVNTVPA